MKKNFKFLLLFIIGMLFIPYNVKGLTSRNVYGINSIQISDESFTISGWAYKTFVNFCNTDNSTYGGYQMTDSSGKKVGIAKNCKGQGYDSVVYKIKAVPSSGTVVYAKNSSGGYNLRKTGISATCVNYYKPTDATGKKSVHCDGELAPFGEFPSAPINYKRRNYNVQNYDKNFFSEGAYFYDDIGFAGEIKLDELEDNKEYTLYLEVTINDNTSSYKIATTGLVFSYEGFSLKTQTAKNFKISSSFYDIAVNHSDNIGVINQDAGAVYYQNSNVFKQLPPSLGGGYFTANNNYYIKNVITSKDISIIGNRERFGSFSLYNLGTTGSFKDNYTTPGDNYTYFAISPWVSFTGSLIIKKTVNIKSECGGTEKDTDERITYCNSSPRPDDYNSCCSSLMCSGTTEGTIAREQYCANNPNDSACCNTVGQCPAESYDTLDPANSIYYTYWDTSVTSENVFTSSYNGYNTNVDNYPKYCSGTDSTSTMFTNDGMLLQYNNAFCYQKGSFTTTSPNQSDYILTYSGGAYSLNVNYDTELVCVSLNNRRVTNVKYYDENCNYKGQASNDGEIHFLDDGYSFGSKIDTGEETFTYWTTCEKTVYPNCPADATNCPSSVVVQVPCQETANYTSDFKYKSTELLKYNRLGKFNISDFEDELKEIPSLYLSDSTTNQTVSKFETTITVQKSDMVKTYAQNNSSLMLDYIVEQQNTDSNFSDPLGGLTKSIFVQKLQLVRSIDKFKERERKFFSVGYTCNSARCDVSSYTYERCDSVIDRIDQTYRYAIDYYYGTLNLDYKDVSYHKCSDLGSTCTFYCAYDYWYKGDVTKTMYITIEDSYKEELMNLTANYTLSSDSVPDSIKERFEGTNEKYVSQVNLSDYYQITVGSTDYDKDNNSGKYFGVAETWNMDKALCALDLTDHPCESTEASCACKYNGANLDRNVYYSECLDFRVVSLTALFPGKSTSLCINPTRNCRQPGRNWEMYLQTGFVNTENIDVDIVNAEPMYHITLTSATMNQIVNTYKDYYTDINLGIGYNPSLCNYIGDSRCSSDYESDMLNQLGSSVFTRNRDIINTRYRQLRTLGVNKYETTKNSSGGG